MKRLIWLFIIVPILCSFFLSAPAQANSNIAISGSFYRYHFKLLPGESLKTPDVFVVVFNQDVKTIRVRLTPQIPSGVVMSLSQTEFDIPGKGEKRVEVGLIVDEHAVPGEHIISITADIQPTADSEGIAIVGSAQQQTKLTILGEAGEVKIATVGLHDEPLPAEIRLYQKTDGQLVPAGYSKVGSLQTRLAPGNYFVQAFYQETEVAKQEFTLAANEKKEIVLKAQLVFIQTFAVAPNYYEKNQEIAFAKISYAVKTFQPLKEAKAILNVSFKGVNEKTEIISLPAVDAGVFDGTYKYMPSQGWENGSYVFLMQVYSEGQLRAQSSEQVLEVKMPGPGNWLVVGLVIGAIVVLVLIIFFFFKRRKNKNKKEASR